MHHDGYHSRQLPVALPAHQPHQYNGGTRQGRGFAAWDCQYTATVPEVVSTSVQFFGYFTSGTSESYGQYVVLSQITNVLFAQVDGGLLIASESGLCYLQTETNNCKTIVLKQFYNPTLLEVRGAAAGADGALVLAADESLGLGALRGQDMVWQKQQYAGALSALWPPSGGNEYFLLLGSDGEITRIDWADGDGTSLFRVPSGGSLSAMVYSNDTQMVLVANAQNLYALQDYDPPSSSATTAWTYRIPGFSSISMDPVTICLLNDTIIVSQSKVSDVPCK